MGIHRRLVQGITVKRLCQYGLFCFQHSNHRLSGIFIQTRVTITSFWLQRNKSIHAIFISSTSISEQKTLDYYRRNGSHVFCCFIDFKKAFDRVDYWLLFCKLLDSNNSQLCCAARRLLAFWYSHQQVFIRWQNTYSQCFNLARGVRQSGILSPYLFKLYVRDLLKAVVKSCIGCNIAGWFINILAYADDMVLLAPHGGVYSVY